MKSYFVCNHETWLEKVREFGPSHGVILPDGRFFFTANLDPSALVELARKHPDFIELPVLYDPDPLGGFSTNFPCDVVSAEDTMLKAIGKISLLNPAFKP